MLDYLVSIMYIIIYINNSNLLFKMSIYSGFATRQQ